MAACAGGSQDRREKPAGGAQHDKDAGILQQRQQRGQGHEQQQQAEGQAGRQDVVEPERGEYRQVEYADRPALQHQGILRLLMAQTPAEGQHGDATERHPGQSELDGKQTDFRRILEQKGHAEKQHDDADLGDRVATGEIAQQRVDKAGSQARRLRRPGPGRPHPIRPGLCRRPAGHLAEFLVEIDIQIQRLVVVWRRAGGDSGLCWGCNRGDGLRDGFSLRRSSRLRTNRGGTQMPKLALQLCQPPFDLGQGTQ